MIIKHFSCCFFARKNIKYMVKQLRNLFKTYFSGRPSMAECILSSAGDAAGGNVLSSEDNVDEDLGLYETQVTFCHICNRFANSNWLIDCQQILLTILNFLTVPNSSELNRESIFFCFQDKFLRNSREIFFEHLIKAIISIFLRYTSLQILHPSNSSLAETSMSLIILRFSRDKNTLNKNFRYHRKLLVSQVQVGEAGVDLNEM